MPDESENTPSAPRLNLKDIAVILPLLGSALAIAYEFGSFMPLGSGAFALFSLSEHLLWALGVFPVVALALLGLAALAVIVAPAFETGAARQLRREGGRRVSYVRTTAIIFCLLFLILCLTTEWSLGAMTVVYASAAFLFSLILLFPKTDFRLAIDVRLATVLTFLGLLAAVAKGIDSTRANMRFTCPAEFNFKDGTRYAVFVRSGELGMLLFDPETQRFTFNKWDELKEIGWRYTPMRSRLDGPPVLPDGASWWDGFLPWRSITRIDMKAVRAHCKNLR